MALDLTSARKRATDVFSGFTSGQKTMLVIAVVATLLGGYLFTKWAATPNYTALYSNLPAADAAAVTEELTTKGVPYQLADGGGTVMVPQAQVYQLRLDMSAQGLPAESVPGYSLLDKQGITTSEFRQRVDYQRAIEGELAKTIGAIEGVSGATVHLVIPSEDLFTKDSKKPTASVLLKTKPGQTIQPGQVQAVVHLVSSSVEGMDPADVAVTDSSGTVLKAPGEEGMVAAAGDARTQQTSAFETRLATELEEMLIPLVGPENSKVTVNSTLDYDKRATTTERFENEDNPILTEKVVDEEYEGINPGATGILGPEGEAGAGGNGGTYNKEQEERGYAVGKVTETVETAPGDVERLNVSVLLNGAVANVDQNAVQDMIATAAGIDEERGDAITVTMAEFDQAAAEAAEKELAEARAAEQKAQLMSLARTVGVAVVILIALFLAYRSARKSAIARYPVAVPIEPPAPVAVAAADLTDAVAELPEAMRLSPAEQERLGVESEIGDMIDRQPDEVAAMLRGWLADRRS